MAREDYSIDLRGENYEPLSPYKFLRHKDRLQQFLGDCHQVTPVTAHLVPTLLCNQRCYFCTYGRYKVASANKRLQMSIIELKHYIDQLSDVGIKGVIFTGGGEPTLYPHLVEGMAYAKEKGLDVALNTNGYRCDDGLIDGILRCNPRYIRISLNNGSALTQHLVTGRNNFAQVLYNIQKFAERKATLSPQTDISLGYVVNIVNIHEMPLFLLHILQIEKSVREKTGTESPIYSLQFRPVSNFTHSKHSEDVQRMHRLLNHLQEIHGREYRDELDAFIFHGDQPSPNTIQSALDMIKMQLIPEVKRNEASRIKIIYPELKFYDLITRTKKTYLTCLACSWYLFIWPDGSLYQCVEWAGDASFSIGNLTDTSLPELLTGDKRKAIMERINRAVIRQDCVTVCAHHEMNILLNKLISMEPDQFLAYLESEQNRTAVVHENFL